MPLNLAQLQAGLTLAMAPGFVPPPGNAPGATIAAAVATAYDTYAKLATACNALNPTVVNLPGLSDGLVAAFDISAGGKDAPTAAEEWADAFEAYWTGALFGATGVVTPAPAADLKGPLEGLFNIKPSAFPAFITAFATAVDTWTKTVEVVDSAVPPPSGCSGTIT